MRTNTWSNSRKAPATSVFCSSVSMEMVPLGTGGGKGLTAGRLRVSLGPWAAMSTTFEITGNGADGAALYRERVDGCPVDRVVEASGSGFYAISTVVGDLVGGPRDGERPKGRRGGSAGHPSVHVP